MANLLLLLSSCSLAWATVWDETLDTDKYFGFAGKYCYGAATTPDETIGNYDLTINFQDKDELRDRLAVWVFTNEDWSWPAVYKNETITCEEMQAVASRKANIKSDSSNTQCTGAACIFKVKIDLTENYKRWWFFVIADHQCSQKGLKGLSYVTHLTDPSASDWNTEFGMDTRGLNSLYLSFFFVMAIFVPVHFYGVKKLSDKLEYLHPMVKIFAFDVFLYFLMVVSRMLHYGVFAQNGKGIPALAHTGEVLDGFSRCLFMLILILIAKGWTISGDELTGKKFIIGTLIGFLVIHFLILVWKFEVEDPASTSLDMGLTVILWIELCLWFAFAGFFAFCVFQSFMKEDNPVKRTLYRNLGIVFTPWFFGYPLVVFLILSNILTDYQRDTSTAIIDSITSTLGYFFLSFLMWPSRAEEYFNINKPDTMTSNIDNYEQL